MLRISNAYCTSMALSVPSIWNIIVGGHKKHTGQQGKPHCVLFRCQALLNHSLFTARDKQPANSVYFWDPGGNFLNRSSYILVGTAFIERSHICAWGERLCHRITTLDYGSGDPQPCRQQPEQLIIGGEMLFVSIWCYCMIPLDLSVATWLDKDNIMKGIHCSRIFCGISYFSFLFLNSF